MSQPTGTDQQGDRDGGSTDLAAAARQPRRDWRVVDIVVLAVLAAACAVIFWIWSNALYPAVSAALVAYPPAAGTILGGWLVAGVLGGLIIRKPGAALACELLAAVLEGFLGTHFGWAVIISGLVQGIGAELGFLLLRYRRWGLGAAMLAGGLSGLFGTIGENIQYNFAWATSHQVAYTVIGTASGVILAGLGAWALVRALRATGVLDSLPSGRNARLR